MIMIMKRIIILKGKMIMKRTLLPIISTLIYGNLEFLMKFLMD